MPTYVMLANWTDQGVRNISDSPRRVDAAKKALEEMGGQFRSVYMTMGAYDLVMIYDAPDDAVAARFTLMLGKLGNVRTTSLRAFPEEAFRQIVNSLRWTAVTESLARRLRPLQQVPPDRQRQEGGYTADAHHQRYQGRVQLILSCHNGTTNLRAHGSLEQRDVCDSVGGSQQFQVD